MELAAMNNSLLYPCEYDDSDDDLQLSSCSSVCGDNNDDDDYLENSACLVLSWPECARHLQQLPFFDNLDLVRQNYKFSQSYFSRLHEYADGFSLWSPCDSFVYNFELDNSYCRKLHGVLALAHHLGRPFHNNDNILFCIADYLFDHEVMPGWVAATGSTVSLVDGGTTPVLAFHAEIAFHHVQLDIQVVEHESTRCLFLLHVGDQVLAHVWGNRTKQSGTFEAYIDYGLPHSLVHESQVIALLIVPGRSCSTSRIYVPTLRLIARCCIVPWWAGEYYWLLDEQKGTILRDDGIVTKDYCIERYEFMRDLLGALRYIKRRFKSSGAEMLRYLQRGKESHTSLYVPSHHSKDKNKNISNASSDDDDDDDDNCDCCCNQNSCNDMVTFVQQNDITILDHVCTKDTKENEHEEKEMIHSDTHHIQCQYSGKNDDNDTMNQTVISNLHFVIVAAIIHLQNMHDTRQPIVYIQTTHVVHLQICST